MAMGLHIDRDAAALGTRRRYAAPALVFPLEATVISLGGDRVDRSRFALIPGDAAHVLGAPGRGTTMVVTLVVSPAVRAGVVRDYAPYVDARRLDEIFAGRRLLPRTRWVDELVHRFVFEREVCERPASRAAQFLEAELVKETFFLGCEQLERETRGSVVFEGDPVASRARTWLEAHLFEPFRVEALVRHCHASESTVLRAFRKAHGTSPLEYWRRRRLEESMQLLESGRYTVTEVAARVGYDTPSAFAAAFRGQFGVAPSHVRPAAGPTLPGHGRPPDRRRSRRI